VYPKRHLCRFVIFRYPPSIPLVSSHSSIYSCSVCRLSPNVVLLLFDVLEVEQQARLTTALRVVEKKNVTLPTVLCPSSFSFLSTARRPGVQLEFQAKPADLGTSKQEEAVIVAVKYFEGLLVRWETDVNVDLVEGIWFHAWPTRSCVSPPLYLCLVEKVALG
jgi:hypothetical protein